MESTNVQLNLKEYLKENYNENLILLSQGNYDAVKRPLLVMFQRFQEKFVELKTWADLLYKISKRFPLEAIQFAVADCGDLHIFHANWHDLNSFGFDADVEPYVYAVDAAGRQFQYEGNVTYDDLVDYAKELIEDKLWRTQAIPEEAGVAGLPNLKTVVASNFEKCVYENDRDVLVTFHSNYTFTHEYNLMDVPRELKDDSKYLVFYNYNAQENYLPLEYKIRELPTSMLILRHDKSKRRFFEHCRNHPSSNYASYLLRRFIAANVTSELKLYNRNGKQKDIEALNQKALVEFLKDSYGDAVKTFLRRHYCDVGFPLIVFFHHFNELFLELKDWIDLAYDLKKRFSYTDLHCAVADFDIASIFHMNLDKLDLFAMDSSSPPFTFAVDAFGNQFEYDGSMTLYKYCEELANNKLYKTETNADEKEDYEKINKLTADNFWSLTLSHYKDVLVTFYKDSLAWESTVTEVIEELKCDLDKLVFYKYNVEKNYLPLELQLNQFPIAMRFPTSMLFLRVDKFKKLYFNHANHVVDDDVTHPYQEDLIVFLAKNTSTELTFWNRKGQRRIVEHIANETE